MFTSYGRRVLTRTRTIRHPIIATWMNNLPRAILVDFLAWTAYALLLTPASYYTGAEFTTETLQTALLRDIGFAWWSAIFTLGAFWMVARYPLAGHDWPKHIWPTIITFCGYWAWSIAYKHLIVFVAPSLFNKLPELYEHWYVDAFSLMSTFVIMIAAVHGIVLGYYYRERGNILRNARITLLRLQLNPHFLFNALNAIAELCHIDSAKADMAIDNLSSLLRESLNTSPHQRIPLVYEITLIKSYLSLQHILLTDKLHTMIEIPDNVKDVLVPSMILQPIVENAIIHGRSEDGHVTVTIRARGINGKLVINISDEGPGLISIPLNPIEQAAATQVNHEWSLEEVDSIGPHEHVGLFNTHARLRSLFGKSASLTFHNHRQHGLTVRLCIPIR